MPPLLLFSACVCVLYITHPPFHVAATLASPQDGDLETYLNMASVQTALHVKSTTYAVCGGVRYTSDIADERTVIYPTVSRSRSIQWSALACFSRNQIGCLDKSTPLFHPLYADPMYAPFSSSSSIDCSSSRRRASRWSS